MMVTPSVMLDSFFFFFLPSQERGNIGKIILVLVVEYATIHFKKDHFVGNSIVAFVSC